MWRGPSRNFSTYTERSPNADCASLPADSKARSISSSLVTMRIPFPPPPAAALRSTG
jgi:hypothetical protein